VTPRQGAGDHRITQNPSMVGVGRDLCGSPSPTPCRSRVTQSRLHSTASRRVWNISREGDSTASLGSLGQGSGTLRGKKFFLMFRRNFLWEDGAVQHRALPESLPHHLLPAGPAPCLRGWCVPLPQPLLSARLGQSFWGKPSDVGSSLRLAPTMSTRQGRQRPSGGGGSQGKNQCSYKKPVGKWISQIQRSQGFGVRGSPGGVPVARVGAGRPESPECSSQWGEKHHQCPAQVGRADRSP